MRATLRLVEGDSDTDVLAGESVVVVIHGAGDALRATIERWRTTRDAAKLGRTSVIDGDGLAQGQADAALAQAGWVDVLIVVGCANDRTGRMAAQWRARTYPWPVWIVHATAPAERLRQGDSVIDADLRIDRAALSEALVRAIDAGEVTGRPAG